MQPAFVRSRLGIGSRCEINLFQGCFLEILSRRGRLGASYFSGFKTSFDEACSIAHMMHAECARAAHKRFLCGKIFVFFQGPGVHLFFQSGTKNFLAMCYFSDEAPSPLCPLLCRVGEPGAKNKEGSGGEEHGGRARDPVAAPARLRDLQGFLEQDCRLQRKLERSHD